MSERPTTNYPNPVVPERGPRKVPSWRIAAHPLFSTNRNGGRLLTVEQKKCPKTGKDVLTRKESMRRATWWRRARFARMNHYHCTACKGWHIGNDRRR